MSAPSRILVVDDEADVELLISQRFRRQVRAGEFAFVFARDGEQALHLLQRDDAAIDLMLLDINMPVMDGLTLLARLRDLHAPVRAIIVSAYGDMPNIRTAMNRGAFDFVTKPIDMVDLEEVRARRSQERGAGHAAAPRWVERRGTPRSRVRSHAPAAARHSRPRSLSIPSK